jgi:alanine racemase
MTSESSAPATLRVSLRTLGENFAALGQRAGAAEIAPVVKADGYSVGMAPVAKHLVRLGAKSFFVARLKEGVTLRALLPDARIFVFDGLGQGGASRFAAHRLIPVLNTLPEIAAWAEEAHKQRARLPAALHVDTGMNRAGLARDEVTALAGTARGTLAGFDLQLIMSHLACADAPEHPLNAAQLARFRDALARLPPAPASLAATSGISLGPKFLFDVARPGVGLYGGAPQPAAANPYRMAVRLTAPVLQLRQVAPGESVGYGATFTAQRPSTIAIVAAGYADGLIRALGRSGHAIVEGTRVPFAGRISMDLAALDVTDVADQVRPGVEVEFLGPDLDLETQAAAAGTVNHEILTSITARADRVYQED